MLLYCLNKLQSSWLTIKPILLSPVSIQLKFHTNCILTWLAAKNRCPLCQEPVNDSKRIKPALTEGRALPIMSPRPSPTRNHEASGSHESLNSEQDSPGEQEGTPSVQHAFRQQAGLRDTAPFVADGGADTQHSLAEEQIRRNAEASRLAIRQMSANGKKNQPHQITRKTSRRAYSYIDYDCSRFANHCKLFE